MTGRLWRAAAGRRRRRGHPARFLLRNHPPIGRHRSGARRGAPRLSKRRRIKPAFEVRACGTCCRERFRDWRQGHRHRLCLAACRLHPDELCRAVDPLLSPAPLQQIAAQRGAFSAPRGSPGSGSSPICACSQRGAREECCRDPTIPSRPPACPVSATVCATPVKAAARVRGSAPRALAVPSIARQRETPCRGRLVRLGPGRPARGCAGGGDCRRDRPLAQGTLSTRAPITEAPRSTAIRPPIPTAAAGGRPP